MEPIDIVSREGYYIQNYKDQTEELCLAAVKQNGWAIKHCKIITQKIREQAVDTTPRSIIYIDEKYHDELLMYNPRTIGGMNQTEDRQITAIEIDPDVYGLIQNPTKSARELALSLMRDTCVYQSNTCSCWRIHALKHEIKTDKKIKYTPEYNSDGVG